MGSESRPSAHLWLAALAAVLHVPATTPAEHSARTGICSALARLSTAPLRPADSSAGTFTEVDVVAERCFASLQKLLEERSEHGARCASELAAACLALLEAGGRVPPAAPPTAQGVVGVLAALRDGLPLPLLRRWFDVPLEKEVVQCWRSRIRSPCRPVFRVEGLRAEGSGFVGQACRPRILR